MISSFLCKTFERFFFFCFISSRIEAEEAEAFLSMFNVDANL